MSIRVVMQIPGMSAAQYEAVRAAVGHELQPGALLHLAGPVENGWQIVEVWESPEAMGAFFQSPKLGAALQATGLTPAQPIISPVHTHVATGVSVAP